MMVTIVKLSAAPINPITLWNAGNKHANDKIIAFTPILDIIILFGVYTPLIDSRVVLIGLTSNEYLDNGLNANSSSVRFTNPGLKPDAMMLEVIYQLKLPLA